MANRIRNKRLEIKLTEEEKTLFDMLYIISLRYTDMKDIRYSVIIKPRRYKAVWKENTTCLLLSDITEKSSSNAFFFLYTPFLRRLHRDHMCVNAAFFH